MNGFSFKNLKKIALTLSLIVTSSAWGMDRGGHRK